MTCDPPASALFALLIALAILWVWAVPVAYGIGRRHGWDKRANAKGQAPKQPMPGPPRECEWIEHAVLGSPLHYRSIRCRADVAESAGKPITVRETCAHCPRRAAIYDKARQTGMQMPGRASFIGEKPPRDTGHLGTPMDRIPLRKPSRGNGHETPYARKKRAAKPKGKA